MPQTIVIESYKEFCERNGGTPTELGTWEHGDFRSSRWIGLPSGARVYTDDEKVRQEAPPAGSWALLLYQEEYWKARLALAEQDFDRFRRQCDEHAELAKRYVNFSGPGPEAPAILKQLATAVTDCRKELAAIDAQLAEQPQARAAREYEEQRQRADQERRAASATIMAQLREITV